MKLPNLPRPFVYGRFSYALNWYDSLDYVGEGKPGRWRRKRRDHTGLCLTFGPAEDTGKNDLKHLNDITRNPLLPSWVANGHNQLWLVQRRMQTVIAAQPVTAPKLNQAPAGAGVALLYKEGDTWKKKAWPYRELYKYCYSLEKIGSNCARCERSGLECIRDTIKSWAEHNNIDPAKFLPSDEPECLLIDDWEIEDIEEHLHQVSARTPWEFVHPKLTVEHPFAPKLLNASELDFREVETQRKERRERAKKAAQTKKALVRCKECFFHRLCHFCEAPYFGRPYECQVGRRHDVNIPGPFSERQAYDAAESFWHSLPHIEREKIELIAHNAGISTYIFGYELRLGKMTAEMDGVEFFRPTTHERRYVDFDEAIMLCTTPYRHNGKYEYPEKLRRTRPMTDEELYTYVEICQHQSTRNRGYQQPSSLEVLSVVWNPGAYRTFESETGRSYGLSFSDMRDIMKYEYGLPTTVTRFMKTQEEVGKDCPETNLDTQS